MADKKTDFEELFGKKEPEKKPKKAASATTQRKSPAASAPKQSASDVRKENKSGLAGGGPKGRLHCAGQRAAHRRH